MIELRPFTEKDFSRLIKWIDSPRTLIQWGAWIFAYPLDEKQLQKYLQDTAGENPERMAFTASLFETQEVVGHIELDKVDRGNGTASICRVFVDSKHRGQGICTRMIRRILDIGFNQLGLHRVDLQVYDFNVGAIACYEKVGFVREGLLREVRKVGDEYWNLVWMGILKEEWKARGWRGV